MTMLAEDPKLAIFLGIIALAVLASTLTQTRRYLLVFSGMVVVILLTTAGVVFERLVETEKEQIEAVLGRIETALEANDLAQLLEHVSPEAEKSRYRARWALEAVEITDARVRNLEVVVNRLTSPPTAEARFDGTIRFRYRMDLGGRDFYPARFVVQFQLEDDRWLLTDHVEYQLQRL